MAFDALDAEDYALGQAMSDNRPSGIPAFTVSGYPDAIPAGTAPQSSNGWSVDTFNQALQSVSGSIASVAKTVYGIENASNQMTLQRIQTAGAIDVARAQALAQRDSAVASAQIEQAKAQAIIRASDQAAKLNAAVGGWGSYEVIMLILAGAGVWYAMRHRGRR